jgi:uncharacterized SAM-binding protein YcdF (DUF218 family)
VLLLVSLGAFYGVLLMRVLRQAVMANAAAGGGICLVFGKKLRHGAVDDDFRCRLERLLQLPRRPTILLGGETGGPVSEAGAGRDWLLRRGFDVAGLHLEESSRNTLENLKNARRMLASGRGGAVVIVSNRYHLKRCAVLAGNLGFSFDLCAAEDRFRWDASSVGKCLGEAFYLHWFYTGKYWARLTGNRRMLDRIR